MQVKLWIHETFSTFFIHCVLFGGKGANQRRRLCNSVNWKSICTSSFSLKDSQYICSSEKLVRVGVDVLFFGCSSFHLSTSCVKWEDLSDNGNMLTIFLVIICVFCVIGDHFWGNQRIEDMLCHTTTIITYTEAKDMRKETHLYHLCTTIPKRSSAADNIDAQLILLTYNSLESNGLPLTTLYSRNTGKITFSNLS